MLTTLRAVAISFLYVCKIFIKKMDCSEALYTTQKQVGLADERLNIIKKKIATSKQIKTGSLKRKVPVPSNFEEEHWVVEKL